VIGSFELAFAERSSRWMSVLNAST